ncbi:MAG TPA: IPT/TIG domain-containing protein [Vicinamibacterales bacterium]|nr:IPT/TIG domain-containing protein [Vicinamibacterales bacterium]
MASPPFAVTSVFPASGSTTGTKTRIVGSQFTADAVVRVDGVVTPAVVISPSVIELTMPAHAPGPVDIVVTEGNAAATLHGGYTYVFVEPPVVSSITPGAGALEGNNLVEITGTGFQLGATVKIDGVVAEFVYDGFFGLTRSSTLLPVWAPVHPAGAVDVVVTNPDGQVSRIPAGYRYQGAENFDFNGVWTGFAWEVDLPITFTIQNNMLVSVSCGPVLNHTFSPPPAVTGGKFSIKSPDGSMDGTVLSPIEATGSIDLPGCAAFWGWQARK